MEIVYREVEGLPKGTVKAVIDAYGELVDEGCLAVFGPSITDNCAPTKAAIEERFHVPAISVTGSEDWLGEWTFSLSDGLADRRADLLGRPARQARAHRGRRARRAVAGRRDLHQVLPRAPAATRASASSPRSRSPRPRRTSATPSASCTRRRCRRSCTAASGSAVVFVGPVFEELGWDPPRFMGTAFQNAWINPIVWNAIVGWTGLDQYDDGQPGRPGLPRPVRGDVRAAPGVLRPGREPRPRHRAAARLRRRPSAVARAASRRRSSG